MKKSKCVKALRGREIADIEATFDADPGMTGRS
jgi:hypothetical protein